MTISQTEFLAMQARLGQKPSNLPDAPESVLHDQVATYCRQMGYYYIHSRMDRPSTIQVGAPDFVVALPNGRVLWVECKRKDGKLRTEQLAAAAWLKQLKHRYCEVRSLDDFATAAANEGGK